MIDEIAISIRNLSKKYTIDAEEGRKSRFLYLVKEILGFQSPGTEVASGDFWALRNITFDIKKGQSLGIVGLNGAGKSTLLKVILGRIQQNEGEIHINGLAGGLLELSAGFHPELDGIRNIYNKGFLLGKSKLEIDSKLDAIVKFADLGEFINTPVKSYSSGMHVRLGFSIVIHFLPEIIVCDEILAVGDFDFRQKCFEKILDLRNRSSFVLVSHSNSNILQLCDVALLLHKGELISIGNPRQVLKHYSLCNNKLNSFEIRKKIGDIEDSDSETVDVVLGDVEEAKAHIHKIDRPVSGLDPDTIESLFGPEYELNDVMTNVSFYLNLPKSDDGFYHFTGETLTAFIEFTLLKDCKNLRIGLPFFDENGKMVMGPDSRDFEPAWSIKGAGKHLVRIDLESIPVNSGKYWLAIGIKNDPAFVYRRHCGFITIKNHLSYYGEMYVGSKWTKIDKTKKISKKFYKVIAG
jgi:lipopolysaccharide transport system ATP-binding protein